MTSSEQVREEIARELKTHRRVRAVNFGRDYACLCGEVLRSNSHHALAEHQADAILARWPVLAGGDAGCQCIPHWQDAGGGYTEYVPEYEPSCPEHSEHLWNPRTGQWVPAGVTGSMVEAGARAAFDQAFMKHAPEHVDRWDDLVADNDPAVQSWRDVSRAALTTALGSRDADAPGDGGTT